MFCRIITSFMCIFVAAVIATVHNGPHSIIGSGPEVTKFHLKIENPESSTREPEQQVTETTAEDLGALLDAGDGAVVTLLAGDTRLEAHRAVLVDRSPVFAATLQRMTPEAGTSEVAIPDVEGPVLRQLLAYMYTLQAPQLPGMVSQLLAAADTYGLSSLKAHIEQQVAAQLSVETAAAAAILAVQHSSASLRQAAVSFIKAHISHVMATRGWADAINSQPEEFLKVMRLLSEAAAEDSAPAPATSGANATTKPDSDHCGSTPASAASTTAAPPDDAPVCPLWCLSADEKNGRLINAATRGVVEEVDALLKAGADVDARGELKRTPLHWAVGAGHVEVARRLLAAGADVEARESRWQWTPLHYAAYKGRAAAVRLLLEEGSAEVDARDVEGWTALHEAAKWGHPEVAAILLQAGADRWARGIQGWTPLDLAKSKDHQQLIDMLA